MLHAFLMITAEPARVAELSELLADVEGIAEVYSVAGEVDLIAIVRVPHHDDLADVVTRHVAQLPGIIATRTMVAFKAYSRRDLDALWDIGE